FQNIGPFPPVRLRRPGWWTLSSEGHVVQFSSSGFRYSSSGSTVEDRCYLPTRDFPNGFPFPRFLGFVCVTGHNFARKLPFEMVTKDYRCDKKILKYQTIVLSRKKIIFFYPIKKLEKQVGNE